MDSKSIERLVLSADETLAVGAAMAQAFEGGDVIGLDGALGAGKTMLVRGIAEGLSVDPRDVSSPTFVIMQRYRGARLDLVHADAYRLQSVRELEATGWSECAGAPETIAMIEWASRIESALPLNALRITLEHVATNEPIRRLRISDPDPRRFERLRLALESLGAFDSPEMAVTTSGIPMAAAQTVLCPVCGATIGPTAATAPFCSPRCKSADLGRWLSERYRVSRPLGAEDFPDD